jgi:hypothetical protein
MFVLDRDVSYSVSVVATIAAMFVPTDGLSQAQGSSANVAGNCNIVIQGSSDVSISGLCRQAQARARRRLPPTISVRGTWTFRGEQAQITAPGYTLAFASGAIIEVADDTVLSITTDRVQGRALTFAGSGTVLMRGSIVGQVLAAPTVRIGLWCTPSEPCSFPGSDWYPDRDGDGYGALGDFVRTSSAIRNFSAQASDCNDSDPDVHPGSAAWVPSSRDMDCDGVVSLRWQGHYQCGGWPLCHPNSQAGWDGHDPPCGDTRTYVARCVTHGTSCFLYREDRTQLCR